MLYNIFYEVFTVCTSIVAEDKTGKKFNFSGIISVKSDSIQTASHKNAANVVSCLGIFPQAWN